MDGRGLLLNTMLILPLSLSQNNLLAFERNFRLWSTSKITIETYTNLEEESSSLVIMLLPQEVFLRK
jgi:hypothetical protein